jgi:hypothetical protein
MGLMATMQAKGLAEQTVTGLPGRAIRQDSVQVAVTA